MRWLGPSRTINRLLSRWTLDTGEADLFVSVQNPLALGEQGEPQPDLTLVRRRRDRSGTPVPSEVLLIVEVADTSLVYDRERKFPLYAEAGISEVWLVDFNADAIEVYSEPGPGGYEKVTRCRREGRVVSVTLPDLGFDVAEALPPKE